MPGPEQDNRDPNAMFRKVFYAGAAAVVTVVVSMTAAGMVTQISTNASTANELKHVNESLARVETGIESTSDRIRLLEERVRALEIQVGRNNGNE